MGSADFPNDLPIRTVQASDGSLLFVVGGYQEEVLAVEGRGGGIGLVDDVVGDFGLPKNFSIHGKSSGMGGTRVEEIDVELFSVAGERAGGVGTLFIQLHEPTLVNLSGPEELARGTVEAKNALGLLLFVRGRENHSIIDHDGRAVSAPGNFRLPKYVL